MPIIPGNYGKAENYEPKRKRMFKFDFTFNIPSLIAIATLTWAIIHAGANVYKSVGITYNEHRAMWAVFRVQHPTEARLIEEEGK